MSITIKDLVVSKLMAGDFLLLKYLRGKAIIDVDGLVFCFNVKDKATISNSPIFIKLDESQNKILRSRIYNKIV
jgi:hypothetical protein